MKKSWPMLGVLLLLLLVAGLVPVAATPVPPLALAQVGGEDPAALYRVAAAGLPVYARLVGRDGPYLLVGATPGALADLRRAGLDVLVLDTDSTGTSYYLAAPLPGRPRPDWSAYGDLLLDDGVQVLLRTVSHRAEQLAAAGVEISALSLDPIALHPRSVGSIPKSIRPDPLIAEMIAQVDRDTLSQYEEWLSGEKPTEIGGQTYTITTRYTSSGTPIQKATQFAYEHLAGLGLEVEYNQWGGATYPNVIATRSGLTDPDVVFIICAHLDDMPSGSTAPGADDNASGSTGVLMAADILSQYRFGCTLKFILWTGEEQGLLGSDAWAAWAGNQGLDIQGVLNMDMIAYDSDAAPVVDLHARSWLPDSVALANLFADVVEAYNLDLEPNVLVDNWLGDYSDNKSFWDKGYAAILSIEDYDDFTPYYHSTNDRLSTLNMTYFTTFVQAAVGTLVHASDCLLRPQMYYYLPLVIRSTGE